MLEWAFSFWCCSVVVTLSPFFGFPSSLLTCEGGECVQILAENLLERLPSTVGKLRSLKVLTLDSNRLSLLPEEGSALKHVQTFRFQLDIWRYNTMSS